MSLRSRLRSWVSGHRRPAGEVAALAPRDDAATPPSADRVLPEPFTDGLDPGARKLAERFARFREPGRDRFFLALSRHLAPLADSPVVDMYFEFAVTSNERGRNVARVVERYGPLTGKAALDVGCAYGGFVVAFSEAGADATGIDLDPGLLSLGRLNLEDHGLAADLLQGDATSPEVARLLEGRFDVVTCNDVIEHVEEPAALVRSIAAALRPGGLAYLEIPNRNLPAFILEDGHYRLFGIVLLDRPEAERYYAAHAPGTPYGVGHYLGFDEYRDLFAAVGLGLSVLPETFAGVTVESTLDGARSLREALPGSLRTLPEAIRAVVEPRALRYLEEIEGAPRTTSAEQERFLLTYGPGFWKVLARRSG